MLIKANRIYIKNYSIKFRLFVLSKKIKIHRSIWGKSLVKGRKRGTCAEFKVANQLLNDGKTLDDLIINVVENKLLIHMEHLM